MHRVRPVSLTLLLYVIAALPFALTEVSDAEAQMKSMRRGPGNTRPTAMGGSSSVSDRVQRDARSISTTRTKSSLDPSASDDADATNETDDDDRDTDSSARARDGRGAEDEAGERDEEIDYDSRTLGRACMYGADDEVIYRPKGARCRGDAPAAPARRPARRATDGSRAPVVIGGPATDRERADERGARSGRSTTTGEAPQSLRPSAPR